MANDKILEIVSNSDFKVFLDQGGDDRNQLSEILEMSDQEFHALADPEPGQCLIVWGDKILQCDSKISKDNPLYKFYTTNFHEEAQRRTSYELPEHTAIPEVVPEAPKQSQDTQSTGEEEILSDEEQRLLQCVEDAESCEEELHAYEAAVLTGLDLKTVEILLEQLCRMGLLEEDENKSYRRK